MTFEEARKRPDYQFKNQLAFLRKQIVAGNLEAMDADSDPIIGAAVLEIGFVDIELNLAVRAMFDDADHGDKTPVPEYFCCIKFGLNDSEWDCDGHIPDETNHAEQAQVKVDWTADDWEDQLERDMFETLNWYVELKGYSYDSPNDLKIGWEEKPTSMPGILEDKNSADSAAGLANYIGYLAIGWRLAIVNEIAGLNKSRILAELDAAVEDIEEIRKYIEGVGSKQK